jgi:hydroxymethylpyrimidine pyrophosphatase-like HAD family hydrolase
VIDELGLDLEVILNKGSVMVLPASVNKATGLSAALEELGIAPQDVVGIGDAENDEAFLALCGFGVAVANALDSVKACADQVTRAENGAGVGEVIDLLIAEDLRSVGPEAPA